MNDNNHTDFVSWRFGDSDRIDTLILKSRKLYCYEGSDIAWTRSFHTRSEARACFDGDVRAMRKNDTYKWVVS